MSQQMVPRWVLRLLIAGVLVLPIAICVIWAVSLLLGVMDDPSGLQVLRYIALGAGILLAIDLIGLVLVLGFLTAIFSSLDSQANFGVLLATTIVVALVANFLLMPALILTFEPFGPAREKRA